MTERPRWPFSIDGEAVKSAARMTRDTAAVAIALSGLEQVLLKHDTATLTTIFRAIDQVQPGLRERLARELSQ